MVAVVTTYEATARRDGRFWLIEVHGLGWTQARHVREIEPMARDLVASMRRVPVDSVEVVVTTRLPDKVQGHLARAEELRQESARAQAQAATEVRTATRELLDVGLTLRDVAQLLGVSYQRVHQLTS